MLSTFVNTEESRVRLTMIDPHVQLTQGVVMGCPLRMLLYLLLCHLHVDSATRCQTSLTQEDTRQALVILRGPLSPSLNMGNWGTFYLRLYTPEPLHCFRY